MEVETERDTASKEVANANKRLNEIEEAHEANHHALQAALEESNLNVRKLEDERRNLEICLNDSNSQIQELKARHFLLFFFEDQSRSGQIQELEVIVAWLIFQESFFSCNFDKFDKLEIVRSCFILIKTYKAFSKRKG
jgi:hypothetical protein